MRDLPENLTELLLDRAKRRPAAQFGMVDKPLHLADAVDAAKAAASDLVAADIEPGARVAVIGTTSNSYLIAWLGLTFVGAEPALINPAYPDELLADMIANLDPVAVMCLHREVPAGLARGVVHIDASAVDRRNLQVNSTTVSGAPLQSLPGLSRSPLDVAGFMHTSGTTGSPKFCAQTHAYFLRLGKFVADAMRIGESDTVFAPLPMFHINPLGYGVVGGLTGGANVLGAARFSASAFWPSVRKAGVTAVFLHGPPIEILKQATSPSDAVGHRVRSVFFADDLFLETFGVPLGFSGYGSTEGGGLSHIWQWRRGERPDLAEGMSRYGGRSRQDVDWAVLEDGEIVVRGRSPGALFAGYWHRTQLVQPFDGLGWFHTGDLGRIDADGNLVFIERRAEAIRVKGEYVPISYVEQQFSTVAGVSDAAVWRRKGRLGDDEIVLYVVADEVPLERLRGVADSLPPFMRPAQVACVRSLPRDLGVGKVQRRLLDVRDALELFRL